MTETRTLPEHATCTTHEHYLLSCADYEELLAESGGGCQMCSFPASQMPQKRLYIDHGQYIWCVRGLLCIRCNSGLDDPRQEPPEGTGQYLASAWYVRKLAERGLSMEDPEPPIGAVVQDYRGIFWHHSGPDRWTSVLAPITRNRTWEQMYRLCGGLGMTVIYTWDGRDYWALDRDLPPIRRRSRLDSRALLERRVNDALAVVKSHQWCPEEQVAVEALLTALTA